MPLLAPLLLAGTLAADPADLDRTAIDVLKDLHNRGADLYNAADAPGALKTYEAALRAVGPFLAHRPKVQQAIDDGLAEAGRLDGPKAQAFKLHEVIGAVREELKAEVKAAEPKPPPPMQEPKRVDPPPPPAAKLPVVAVPPVRWALPWPR